MKPTINDLKRQEEESVLMGRSTLYFDTEAGEWVYICSACNEVIYAPTRGELNQQRFKHIQIRPLELRKCPVIY